MKKTNYFNLTLQMALTDFKLKYAGSILGYVWSLVKPLLLFGILYIVFTLVFHLGKGIPNYPVYLLLGIVLWSFFLEGTLTGMRSVVQRQDLIRKVNFPKIIIVIAAIITASLSFLLNMIVVFVFLAFSKINLTISALVFIPLVVELIIFVLGVSLILATLFAKFKDFIHIWEVGLQVLFYATPIIYPISLVPTKFVKFMMVNPIAQIFQDARWALISRDIETSWSVISFPKSLVTLVIVLITVVVGFIIFLKSAKDFAEEI
jgi:ABC-2 type transport system permease protein